jgi:TonB-linked SusC/RagA family outer membrane protein
MKKLLQSLFILLFIACAAMAQNRTITGKVTSKEDGLPLPVITVRVSGTNIGVQTNENGSYTIIVPASATALEFVSIGYMREVIPIAGKSTINAALRQDDKVLNEVVVTSFGVQRKRDVAGATTQLKGSTIENIPMQSFDRAMQGRMSGVQVTGSNGYPGGAVSIRIRGTGSINAGNNPLYIIDGVQVEGGDFSRSLTSSNSLAGLNSNDIESIDVLKDAAAAAIYGAQAANGVVIITTKKGKSGKTQFSLNYQTGINSMIREIPLTDGPQFLAAIYEARYNAAINAGRTPSLDPNLNANFVNQYGYANGNFAAAPTYSWIDAATRTGTSNIVELSANGGSENTTFFISGSYNKTQGQLIQTDFTRGTFRANLNHKASSKLSFDAKINLATYSQNAVASSNESGSMLLSALTIPSIQPIYNPDGSFADPVIGTRSSNVIKVANYDINKGTTNQLLGSASATYQIINGLSFKSSYYLDYTDILEDRYIDPRTISGSAFAGQANALNTRNINWSTDQVINYNKSFGSDHVLSALLGFSYRNVVRTTITAQGRGFPNELFTSLQNAATPFGVSSNWTTWRLAGYYTSANYSYKGRYIASATLRYDGSSRFGADKKFGLFPAASLAWRLSEENFLKKVKFLNELKLRASYGVTGNSDIDNFASLSLFGGTGAYNNVGGINPSQLGNPLLTWEESHSQNIGLDYALFNSRITGSVDLFRRDSKNLLLEKPLPTTSGFSTINQNVGAVRNQGIEFEISTLNINKEFKWRTDFNYTFISNKVTKLLDGQDRIGTTVFLGKSLSPVYIVEFAGVNAATGRGFFYDVNNELTYIPSESGATDARRIIGYGLAKNFGGLTNTFSYKGIELAVFLQSQFGNILVNNNAFFAERGGAAETNYTIRSYDRRWTSVGQITDQPRFISAEPNHRGLTSFSSRNYENASYVRLKQVSLGYQFDKKLLSKIKVNSLKVFAQAINLATITGYTGYDPELNGADLGVFPQGKMVTMGIQIGL